MNLQVAQLLGAARTTKIVREIVRILRRIIKKIFFFGQVLTHITVFRERCVLLHIPHLKAFD